MDAKSRRYGMVPAFSMVTLPQNLSTGNGKIPGWSCILSVANKANKVAMHRLNMAQTWVSSSCRAGQRRAPIAMEACDTIAPPWLALPFSVQGADGLGSFSIVLSIIVLPSRSTKDLGRWQRRAQLQPRRRVAAARWRHALHVPPRASEALRTQQPRAYPQR